MWAVGAFCGVGGVDCVVAFVGGVKGDYSFDGVDSVCGGVGVGGGV